jgi:hypothetical protein
MDNVLSRKYERVFVAIAKMIAACFLFIKSAGELHLFALGQDHGKIAAAFSFGPIVVKKNQRGVSV